jgi:hypothetical protein
VERTPPPRTHVPPGRLPPAGSASVSSAQPGRGTGPRPPAAPTPWARAAPRRTARHLAPARRRAALPGAPRAGRDYAAGMHTVSMYIQTPGLRPPAAIPRMRAAPTEPARGDGPDTRGARTLHPRPTADRLRRLRQPRQLATPSPSQAAAAAVVLLLPRPISSSSGRPPPPPPSSGSHSSPAELLLQRAQQALVGPRAAASRPQTSRLDRQPAIFRVRRLPDGEEAGRASEQTRKGAAAPASG